MYIEVIILFGGSLKKYRTRAGYTQQQLGAMLGVGKSTISEWESNKRSPDIGLLPEIAACLRVKPADFFAEGSEKKDGDEWCAPVVDAYRTSEELTRRAVCRVLNIPYAKPPADKSPGNIRVFSMAARSAPTNYDDMIEIPVEDLPSAAGAPQYVSQRREMVSFKRSDIPPGTDCGVRISGRSMEPDILNGDIVWVVETPEVLNHQVGIFIINQEEAVCKRAKFNSRGRLTQLMSDNPAEADIPVDGLDEVRVFGRVIGVYHNLDGR